jgi:rhodanese-related sulfurtransferase
MAPFREWLREEDRPTTTVIEEKLVEDRGNVVILEDTKAEIPAPAAAPKHPRVPIGGENILVVDTRDAADFKTGHAPGALNIQADGPFALWLGSIVRPHESFAILIDNDDHAAGVAEGIAKIGYDRQLVSAERWNEEPDHLAEQPLDMDDFREHHIGNYTVVDVRPPDAAAEDTRFYGAINVPFWEMRDRWKEIPVDRPIVVHCGGGYQSAIGASILRKHLGMTVPVYDLGDKIKDFKAKRDLD